jgi:hypothetical protein
MTEREPPDAVEDAAIARVMHEVPRGALALSGLTVGLLLLAWLYVYLFVFLPRGMVG